METFSVALATLNDREGLDILLRRLGRNHRSFGVEDRHYAKACEALIWTIKTSLGSRYTPEIEGAWQALYDHMAEVMIEGFAGALRAMPLLKNSSQPRIGIPAIGDLPRRRARRRRLRLGESGLGESGAARPASGRW